MRRFILRKIRSALLRVAYFGNQRFCPVCGRWSRAFLSFGTPVRRDVRCPFCDSLERHRLVWRYLEEKTDFFRQSGLRMLHVAAEPCFEPRFRRQIGSGYLTADLMAPADVKMDITDIQYPSETFDVVYCSHVLEHVPDDRKAMCEFARVLKSTGWAIVLVPITVETTVEDPTVTDPEERMRLFGQEDHVRRYGRDFVDRLREAGFSVTVTRAEDFLSREEAARIAVDRAAAGDVFFCRKAAPQSCG